MYWRSERGISELYHRLMESLGVTPDQGVLIESVARALVEGCGKAAIGGEYNAVDGFAVVSLRAQKGADLRLELQMEDLAELHGLLGLMLREARRRTAGADE